MILAALTATQTAALVLIALAIVAVAVLVVFDYIGYLTRAARYQQLRAEYHQTRQLNVENHFNKGTCPSCGGYLKVPCHPTGAERQLTWAPCYVCKGAEVKA